MGRSKNHFFQISIILATIIMSCNDKGHLIENTKADGRVIGSIHGIVVDESSNTSQDSVIVYWSDNGKLKYTYTNNIGYYSIADLSPGDFKLTFSKEGEFATGVISVSIPTLQEVGIADHPTDEDFYYNKIQDMELYGLTSSLSGMIYKIEDAENITVANGVKVIADFSNYDILQNEYISESDSEGRFTFLNLPATPNVSLVTLPYNDGSFDHNVSTSNVSLIPNENANASDIFLNIASGSPFIVQNNYENDDFILTDDIVITFSEPMNINSFDISLSNWTENEVVEVESTWSNDVTVTIKPYAALKSNRTYQLSLTGNSIDNSIYGGTDYFETVEGIDFVSINTERSEGVFDEFPLNSNIEIMFTREVDLSNSFVYVYLQILNIDYDWDYIEANTSATLNTLIVTPAHSLQPGKTYRLIYKVASTLDGYDFFESIAEFSTASNLTVPPIISYFVASNNYGTDFNTTELTFGWSTLSDVNRYDIYVRDNGSNSDLILVKSYTDVDYVSYRTGSVDLSNFPSFDLFDNDGIQTPFAAGRELTFKIAAVNAAGRGPLSNAVVIKDETPPSVDSFAQSVSANNENTESSKEISIVLRTNEYLGGEPNFGFIESGGNNSYVLSNDSVRINKYSDNLGYIFRVNVPADRDASGDDFFLTSLIDASGNEADSLFINLD